MNWYLKKLILKYFQNHKSIVLNFTKGLNVLIGETDAGKSAIMRSLRLGLLNTPRGGEKEYQSDFSSEKPYIEIHDSRDNRVVRTNRTYKINDGDPLSAFQSDVPTPLKALFPLKDINVQHQIDPHFLVLDTGGKAGKIISKAIGLEDQQLYLDEIKKRMAESKRLIRSGEDNIRDHNAHLKKLKSIPDLYSKAQKIRRAISEHNDLNESLIIPLQDIMQNLRGLIVIAEKYKNIDKLNSMHQKIINHLDAYQEYRQQTDDLKSSIDQLHWADKALKDINSATKKLKAVPQLIAKFYEAKEIEKEGNALKYWVQSIKENEQIYMRLDMEIDEIGMEYDAMLIEAGKCPFCGTIIKRENSDEHISCR